MLLVIKGKRVEWEKEKKVDKEALASPMIRIPRMDVRVARDLIDIGVMELYELEGRAPDTVFEEIKKRKPDTPDWILPYLRMAVYFFTENENANPQNASSTGMDGVKMDYNELASNFSLARFACQTIKQP